MKHLHFMGIGGQGISAVAQMARLAGENVTGCDWCMSETINSLQHEDFIVQIGHSADHLDGVDTLVISPAVPALDPQNPELLAAKLRGLPIVTWQELLGNLMRGKCVLSISGVHGKSTTTSMLSLLLTDAGLDPTCVIGAVVPRFGVNYRLGKGHYVVNEADEFNHNFWHYHPRLAIVKSIEYEHPEFFADYETLLGAFEHFIRGMDMQGDWLLPPTLLLNADNAGCLELLARLHNWPGRVLTFSIEHPIEHNGSQRHNTSGDAATKQVPCTIAHQLAGDATSASSASRGTLCSPSETPTFVAHDIKLDGETSFRVRIDNSTIFADQVIHLRLPGIFNIENALSALAAAHCIGIPADSIINTLESFSGTRRRFDIQHEGSLQLANYVLEDVILVDDYAHHPTAIAATLEGTRRRYTNRRLIAVYQPHMYSRTKAFFKQFLYAFNTADVVIIADIFPAREHDTGLIHSRDLVWALAARPHFTQGGAQVHHGGDALHTVHMLAHILQSGDLVVVMGAGDIYAVTDQLLHSRPGEMRYDI